MTTVALREIAVIHGGGRLKLTGRHFIPTGAAAYGAGGLNGYVGQAEYRRPGVVLSSIGARCGKCFLAEGDWTSLANTQVILPDLERVDARFLWYQLNDEHRWPRAGSAQPFIKPSDVKAHLVWLPELSQQRDLVAVLDRADALRAKRRQSLSLLSDLARSVFDSMFGDPAAATQRVPLGEIAALAGGRNLVAQDTVSDSPFRVLKISAVTTGTFKPTESKPLPADYIPPESHLVRGGDLLMSRANTTELVGAVAYVGHEPTNLVLPDKIWRFEWRDPESDPVFGNDTLIWPHRDGLIWPRLRHAGVVVTV